MILAWLGKTFMGLSRGWWLVILVAAIGLAFAGINHWIGRTIDVAQQAGATAQREVNLTKTLNNVEKANDAAETVVRDPDAARAECLRNARNPANC